MPVFKKAILAVFLSLFALPACLLFAPGNAAAGSLETQYFSVEYCSSCDLADLALKLNAQYFLRADIFSQRATSDIRSSVSRLIDAIYLEVCDILDIRLYSFKGTLNILPNKSAVMDVIAQLSGQSVISPSFYFPDRNTVYISFEDLNVGILAHEMAHALISHYFVVSPPPKVQEVLTGYVEYSLRKATGTLSEIRR